MDHLLHLPWQDHCGQTHCDVFTCATPTYYNINHSNRNDSCEQQPMSGGNPFLAIVDY